MPQTVILHCFPTFAVGGSQIRFIQLANHFGDRYRHLIVPMDGVDSAAERIGAHVPFSILKLDIPKQNTLKNIGLLRAHLRSVSPDLLITYNWGSVEWGMANLFHGCRQIHIEDGFGPDEAHGQKRSRVLTRRAVLSWRAQVVLPSRTLYDIASRIWKLPRSHLHYVPNGIDCGRFLQAPVPALTAPFRRHPDDLVIGTVAALRAEKNIGRLIDAFALLRAQRGSVRLVIVGDGPERAGLEDKVRSLGLAEDVFFTGALQVPAQVLRGFDIFALSSNTEQMPYSVLEAMAAALPLVCTDVGDVRTMVSAVNRPFVVAPDVVALGDALSALAGDAALRQSIGADNLAQVNDLYHQDKMFARYQAMFDGPP